MKTASTRGLAVVTGAAGGLGSAFAIQLAQQGFNLLLVDRRRQLLEQLCSSISTQHGIHAEPFAVDLCQRGDVERLAARLEQTADTELLVNNAGFGSLEYFVDSDVKSLLDMVDVHVAAPVMLTRAVLPGMIDRNRGAIINVSSLSAFLRGAGNVQYGSTKCFLASFSMALYQELRGSNVRVQALCPGFIRTEFHEATCMKGFTLQRVSAGRLWMTADEVVSCSLRKLRSQQVIVIPGMAYSIFGRLAQMPLLQPFMQWMTHVPRLPTFAPLAPSLAPIASSPEPIAPALAPLAPGLAPTIELDPVPAFAVVEFSESATA